MSITSDSFSIDDTYKGKLLGVKPLYTGPAPCIEVDFEMETVC